jgi:hypothetical protein
MERWRFIGITGDGCQIRVDNPDVPEICSVETAKSSASKLTLKYQKRSGFKVVFRHCICECLTDKEKSFLF